MPTFIKIPKLHNFEAASTGELSPPLLVYQQKKVFDYETLVCSHISTALERCYCSPGNIEERIIHTYSTPLGYVTYKFTKGSYKGGIWELDFSFTQLNKEENKREYHKNIIKAYMEQSLDLWHTEQRLESLTESDDEKRLREQEDLEDLIEYYKHNLSHSSSCLKHFVKLITEARTINP